MKNQVDFMKIRNGELGAINFNSMIPVPISCLSRVEIRRKEGDCAQDIAYRNLPSNQLSWCNPHRNEILRQAGKLYEIIVQGKAWKQLAEWCCNFTLDEQRCLEYGRNPSEN